MGSSRDALARERIFDELLSAMNSADPLESALSRVARMSRGAGLVINELGEVVRSVGSAPVHLIARWTQEEVVGPATPAGWAESTSGAIGRWKVHARTVRLRSRAHVIVVAVHADDEEAGTAGSERRSGTGEGRAGSGTGTTHPSAEVILDVLSKLLRAFEGFESFSISNRREESSRVLRDLEAGVSPGREPALWRVLETFGFAAYEPIRALRLRIDASDSGHGKPTPNPGRGLVIKDSGHVSSMVERTALCTADFDIEGSLDDFGLIGVGVSGLFTALSQVPEMLQTADVALASAGESRFAFVDRMRPIEWAAARMSSRFDRRLVAAFLNPIIAKPESSTTLRTYVESGGNISEAAGRLHVHENTVRYRIGQIEKVLGARLTDPRTAAEIVLALQCLDSAEHA
ncbi:helix-turn-helix domain-containing protein [Brevibacterium sediminis]|uniref:PucR family transcriptional regulator n=1 Tax=Brevibacterium sediminis TaxID=1857024 RepID=UPI0021752452|nr:PucR family transcriptional regulator [Brevibacterium sediminis]MCS4594201.1 helix-turn-helix domain-containing protein [Brevibacterium sediminis]